MPNAKLYYLVEPADALPIWFTQVVDGIRKTCVKNRHPMQELRDVSELDALEELPQVTLVVCSQTHWTRHIVGELRARHIMPILLGVIPDQFGDDVSGILLARRVFIEKVIDYFLGCGRRRMALVGVNPNSSNDNMKVDVFLRNARALDLSTTERDVYRTDEDFMGSVYAFLDNCARYDSVICSNDYVAAFLLAQARERGIRIPEELYVVGLGDTLIGRYTQPTLTSTSKDEFTEMGRQAVNMWRILNANPQMSNMTITVTTGIIPRGSTAFAEPRDYSYDLPTTASPGVKTGTGSQILRNLENCLRACDALDQQILRALLRGDSIEQMEETLFIAHSSLHYRLKKLYSLANVTSRAELEKLFNCYLPNF